MKFTDGQSVALDAIESWYSARGIFDGPQDLVFRLFGYAGTGKTTLVEHIVDKLGFRSDVSPNDDDIPASREWVAFGAYTGKAVHVLRDKGIGEATTIHRMMYRPQEKSRMPLMQLEHDLSELRSSELPDATRITLLEQKIAAERKRVRSPSFAFDPQAPVRDASLIVLDEVSMVSRKMAMDLLSFDVPVLVLGDPEQLPPVGGEGWFTDASPDAMLTEITRTDGESPIDRMATAVRVSEPGQPGLGITGMDNGSGRVERLLDDHLFSHDVVLCWRNSVRWALITKIRAALGRQPGMPFMGDKIMILANNPELGVYNGQILRVLGTWPDDPRSPDVWEMAVQEDIDDGEMRMLDVYASGFWNKDGEDDAKDRCRFGGDVAAATFANAITVHKSQGSEWRSVLVLDESPAIRGRTMKTSSGDRSAAHLAARRWLYTACTRASLNVTIAPMGR